MTDPVSLPNAPGLSLDERLAAYRAWALRKTLHYFRVWLILAALNALVIAWVASR